MRAPMPCPLALALGLGLTACADGSPEPDAPEPTVDARPLEDAYRPPPDRGPPPTPEPLPDAAARPEVDAAVPEPPDAAVHPAPDAAVPPEADAAVPPPRALAAHYVSTLAEVGTVDANRDTYMYAPAFVYDAGRYHYFACVGVAGDWIRHKSAPTLAGLADAPFEDVLRPDPGETHNCDPAVIRGPDGRWYLHYSNTPGGIYTDAGVAVADRIDGPYVKRTTDLLGRYDALDPGQYGRGQTTVTRGPDGLYYMAFTNQIAPLEPNSLVILQAPDPSFAVTRTEVARLDPGLIGGYSTQLTFDPETGRFVFIEPAGAAGFTVTSFDTAWQRVSQEVLPLPPGAAEPGEGQAFLADAEGRLLHDSPDAHGSLVVAGATVGPERGGLPIWVTGPNQFRRYRVNPLGVVDVVEARAGAVRIAGWSFDPNDRGWPLETHVYVGPEGDPRREGNNLGPTSGDRPDVNDTQGTTGSHGYDAVLPTAFRGETEVCVAAINVGAGDNEWIACRRVTVGD